MRKSYRVKKEAEFQTVFTQGQSCANRQFVVYMLEKPDQKHFRVGISASVEARLRFSCDCTTNCCLYVNG